MEASLGDESGVGKSKFDRRSNLLGLGRGDLSPLAEDHGCLGRG